MVSSHLIAILAFMCLPLIALSAVWSIAHTDSRVTWVWRQDAWGKWTEVPHSEFKIYPGYEKSVCVANVVGHLGTFLFVIFVLTYIYLTK